MTEGDGGTCFDTSACFASRVTLWLPPLPADCTVAKPTAGAGVNVALAVVGTDGICASGGCLVGVTEQCTNADCPAFGGIAGLQYRSGTYRWNLQGTVGWRASASYVTGAQSMKFGYQGGYLYDHQYTYTNDQFTAYRFNSGVPNQITENINAFPADQRVRYDAFYAQDQKTFGRITLQGAADGCCGLTCA